MIISTAPYFAFSCSRVIGVEIAPIIERLTRADEDGDAYRLAVSTWSHFERPILAGYAGRRYYVQTEGPRHWVEYRAFAMGSEIMGPRGWARLGPVETALLIGDIKHAIDRVVGDWCERHPNAQGKRTPLDRTISDHAERDQIADLALRSHKIAEQSHVQ